MQAKSSQLSVIKYDPTGGKLTNVYSAVPYRFGINKSQMYGVLPLIKELEPMHDTFLSYDKKEVVIGFYEYIDFLWSNLSDKGNTSSIYGVRLFRSADMAHRLFNLLSSILKTYVERTGNMDLYNCKRSLTENMKKRIQSIVEENGVRDSLKYLWDSFLVNVAMLNIKSLTLSGERSTRDNKTVPIKFIPKIGRELSLISLDGSYDLMDFLTKYRLGSLGSPIGKTSVIASLHNGSILTLPDVALDPVVYVAQEAEERGYSQQRQENAIQNCVRTLSTEYEVDYYMRYVEEIEGLIESCSSLVNILGAVNNDPKDLVLLDINFHDHYDYHVLGR